MQCHGVEIATKSSATRHGSNRSFVVDVTMALISETMQSDVMELMS
jgi:predicted regulator of amino acid metabolism with ACT domain